MKQHMNAYTAQDQLVWKTLFERQFANLKGKVSGAYLDALHEMSGVMNAQKIPDFGEIDEWFSSRTGWKMEVVPGLIPVDEFFRLLAEKRFCSSTWLRSMDQLDYLEEPDMFHDVFGHIPLLSNQAYVDFFKGISDIALKHIENPRAVELLGRIYWFTIEFGLIKGNKKFYNN